MQKFMMVKLRLHARSFNNFDIADQLSAELSEEFHHLLFRVLKVVNQFETQYKICVTTSDEKIIGYVGVFNCD